VIDINLMVTSSIQISENFNSYMIWPNAIEFHRGPDPFEDPPQMSNKITSINANRLVRSRI
jgi:hypothetical protein